jgi:hypothetical protein
LEQDSTLQIPPVSSFSPQTQPVSSYTYCNDAFRKLNQKNALSTPAVCAQSDTGEMPKRYCSEALINEKKPDARESRKPHCNQAFLKLNEKKSAAAFTPCPSYLAETDNTILKEVPFCT